MKPKIKLPSKKSDMNDQQDLFQGEAERYDKTIRLVDPQYNRLHKMLVDLAHQLMSEAGPSVALDLGSGTGSEAIGLLKKLPHLKLVGIDASSPMHEVFQARARKEVIPSDRYHLINGDLGDMSVLKHTLQKAVAKMGAKQFKLITSAFTIHHFDKKQKLGIFEVVHELLEPGGMFLLGDLFNFKDESPWLDLTVSAWEKNWMENSFDKCITRAGKKDAAHLKLLKDKWLHHYRTENHLDSVPWHFSALDKAGFKKMGNPFRYWLVGLVFAMKNG